MQTTDWINKTKRILVAKLGASYRDILPIDWDAFEGLDPESAAAAILKNKGK